MTLKLPPRDKFVLVALCDHYNAEDECAFMSQRRLASYTGYTRATVNAALHALEHERGLIESEARTYEDGRNRTKVYRVHVGLVPPTGLIPEEIARLRKLNTTRGEHVKQVDTSEGHVKQVYSPHVKQVDTPHVKQLYNKNPNYRTRTIEPELKTHTSENAEAAQPQPLSPNGDAREITPPAEQRTSPQHLLDAYNENRGPLPAALTLNDKRKRALAKIAKTYAHRSLEIIRAATRQVATDSFWIERGYGLDVLLAGEKYVAKAEAWQQNKHLPRGQADRTRAARIAQRVAYFEEQDRKRAEEEKKR